MIARNVVWAFKGTLALVALVSMLASAAAVTTLAATAPANAQDNKKDAKPAKSKQAKGKDNKGHDKDAVVVVDRDGHHRVVREYVTRGNLPPGLAKRRTLPPGLSQQLREKGTLPPGLRDYYTLVPADWNPRFPAIPTYYQRYFVGNHLIIVDTRDNTLVSLIRDLLN